MTIYKTIHVYYLNKSHDLLKKIMTQTTREWSLQLLYSGLKEDNSKLVWRYKIFKLSTVL